MASIRLQEVEPVQNKGQDATTTDQRSKLKDTRYFNKLDLSGNTTVYGLKKVMNRRQHI